VNAAPGVREGSPHAALVEAWARSGGPLCVGLDPDPERLPRHLGTGHDALRRFCRDIVDATADLVCAFKPQIAHFAALGAEPVLEELCRYLRRAHPGVVLVLDAKRGDIGSTAERYAAEAFDRYGATFVTVSPYLGFDTIEPFLVRPDRGVFVLCRTSNPGSADLQSLPVDGAGTPLYAHVAAAVAQRWGGSGQVGLVVGATYPAELAAVRARVGELPLLVPGVGAQGGDPSLTMRAGRASSTLGVVVNSSRDVIFASQGADFATAARHRAAETSRKLATVPA
jgi:orotidine-5'-phosphate decarboxylase